MFQFNVPQATSGIGEKDYTNMTEEMIELHVAESIIEVNSQWEVVQAEFESIEQAIEVAENCEMLAFSLETYGPQDATLALFNGHNDAVCSLLGIDELPTAEQWEESGYTEVAMEGAKEATKAAMDKIVAFFKKIGSMIAEMVKRTIEMVNSLEKQANKQIERLQNLENVPGEVFDKEISVPKSLASNKLASGSQTIQDMANQMAELDPKKVADMIGKEKLDSSDKDTLNGIIDKAEKMKSFEIGENQKVSLKDLGIKDPDAAANALKNVVEVLGNLKDTQKNVNAVSKAVKKAEKDATKAAKEAGEEVGTDKGNLLPWRSDFSEKQQALSATTSALNKYSTVVRTYARVLISAAKSIKTGKKDKQKE